MATWRDFVNILMTPSSHENDPYLEAANQVGHMALGAILCLGLSVGWYSLFGEMPVREWVWVTVVVGYLFIIEAWLQGWRGRDSLLDTWFIQCGATMSMWPVLEVAVKENGVSLIEFQPKLLGALLTISLASLAMHIWPRVKRYVVR